MESTNIYNQNLQPHGLFDVDSFLTIFYDADIKESEQNVLTQSIDNYYAFENRESFSSKNILVYEKLLHLNILHEEIHYWQAMTSPAIFLNFINLSKALFLRAEALNLRYVFSDTFPYVKGSISDFMYIYRSHRMNFDSPRDGRNFLRQIISLYKKTEFSGTWSDFTKHLKESIEERSGKSIYEFNAPYLHMEKNSYNVISEEEPVAMPFMTRPHLEEGKGFIEYGGLLDYFDLVYFTGDNLMESYAIINEYISKGKPIPEYNVLSGEANKYLGVYEFYRRTHRKRYHSERELAISFLILVDICFTTDSFHDHSEEYEYYEDWRQENNSIPYRFGKLVYKALGFRPFNISEEQTLPSDIEKWEDELCTYLGYYSPEICIKHSIEELLFVLSNDFDGIGYTLPNDIVDTFCTLETDAPQWEEKLFTIIEWLNETYKLIMKKSDSGITLQNHLILAITNALIYRLHNRGKMILSALYQNEVRSAIEPAVFIVGGQYAYNQLLAGLRKPLNDYKIGVFEPIENLVVKPIAKDGIFSCGFMESFYPCRYTANGYGCPLCGLSEAERQKRKTISMPDNRCHYTRMMNIIKRK